MFVERLLPQKADIQQSRSGDIIRRMRSRKSRSIFGWNFRKGQGTARDPQTNPQVQRIYLGIDASN